MRCLNCESRMPGGPPCVDPLHGKLAADGDGPDRLCHAVLGLVRTATLLHPRCNREHDAMVRGLVRWALRRRK